MGRIHNLSPLLQRVIGKDNFFLHHIALMVLGTLLSQLAAAIAIPLLSRLYDPASVGLFSLFLTIAGALSVIAAWRYELALPLPAEDKNALSLLQGSIALTIGMVIVVSCIILVGHTAISTAFHDDRLETVLKWLPISLLSVGLYNVFAYWATRRKQFRSIAIAQAASTATPVIQVGLGFLNIGGMGLIIGQLVGQSLSLFTLLIDIWRHDNSLLQQPIRLSDIRTSLIRYNRFPKYNGPHALLNTLSQGLPVLLLGIFFGPNVIGFYGFANRILIAPLNLASQSIQQIFFQRINEVHHRGEGVQKLLIRAMLGLFGIGILPSLIVLIWGRPLFVFILGNRWEPAGLYSQWLILWVFSNLILIPANAVLLMYERLSFGLGWDIVQTLCRMIVLGIGRYFNSAEQSIALFSITGMVFNFILIGYVWRLTKAR